MNKIISILLLIMFLGISYMLLGEKLNNPTTLIENNSVNIDPDPDTPFVPFKGQEIRNYDDGEISPPIYKDKQIMTISAYSPRKCETDSTPFITANNTRVKEGGMAISRDMEEKYGWKLGDQVFIKGLGIFVLNDRMNRRWKLRGDLFFFDTKEALEFGIMENVEVFLIKSSEDV